MADKIINTFQQRRQLEDQINALAQTETEAELLSGVRAVANQYPTEMVLQALVRHLDTNDSQLRGGLGHLATLLPPDETASALRSAAANRQNDPATRLNAALILEKFLGQEAPTALLSDLQDTDDIAFQSLREAVEFGQRNRHVLLEYVMQMRDESEEVALVVLEQTRRLPDAERLELLRLIAQDDRPRVARAGLRELEHISPEEAGDALARALHTLQFTLPPDLAQQASRQLRKLQFSGHGYKPPQPAAWRALLSPAEASGNQAVWLIHTPTDGAHRGLFLNLVVNLNTGILASYGNENLESGDLPAPHPVGELVSVDTVNNQTAVLLEAPFDYGRWLVQQALTVHWAGRAWQPLFGEYTLYNDLIWQFDEPAVADEVAALVGAPADADGEARPAGEEVDALVRITAELLEHPAMASWLVYTRMVVQTILDDAARDSVQDADAFAAQLLQAIAQWPDHAPLFSGYQAGLRAQAGWLQIAGSERNAQHAQRLAATFAQFPPEQNPFLVYLFGQALRAAG